MVVARAGLYVLEALVLVPAFALVVVLVVAAAVVLVTIEAAERLTELSRRLGARRARLS